MLVTGLPSDKLAILGLHDFASNRVRCHVLGNEFFTVCRIEVAVILSIVDSSLPLLHLLINLSLNFSLIHGVLATNSCDAIGLALSSTILGIVGGHALLVGLSVDPVVCVVKHRARDWVLEVVVPLGEVSLRYSSNKT